MLPNERRRFLAQVARRSTNQGLERRKERKFPILPAFVAQAVVDQLDEVVALFDQAVSARESRTKSKTDEALVERATKGEARQLVMEMILPVPADPAIPDDEVGGMLRERIGMRMAGSLKYGQATASLIVGKWSAASRQHTLAAALKEWGILRRTVHLAKYLSDPAFRRSLHALRRDLHYAPATTATAAAPYQ
ncbi:Tn3 family transposase [Nonomuraea phyllanthi]|uniref:Tn3 family transposase n=1 Tax=Nonomuraea phyllanthi TaxID=2219224 RepID=UPI00186B4DFF|nr:Tn3 family transposase [Nonomuraea phyllanthi]